MTTSDAAATGRLAMKAMLWFLGLLLLSAVVSVFLVNGVMLQGEIGAYDLFCVMLERDRSAQLVYKHAISTVQPSGAINLNVQDEDGEAIDG